MKLSTKNKIKSHQNLQNIEDDDGFSTIASIAAKATEKGYERAKKTAEEIILVEEGSVVLKKNHKSVKVISKLKERVVKIGKKQIYL